MTKKIRLQNSFGHNYMSFQRDKSLRKIKKMFNHRLTSKLFHHVLLTGGTVRMSTNLPYCTPQSATSAI